MQMLQTLKVGKKNPTRSPLQSILPNSQLYNVYLSIVFLLSSFFSTDNSSRFTHSHACVPIQKSDISTGQGKQYHFLAGRWAEQTGT